MRSILLLIIAIVVCSTAGFLEELLEPNLPFGDINLLVVTDDHSWIGGHGRKEPYLNADYGDVLSFYQRLKYHCDASGKDLWFVMNGDWIDGTSLSLDGDIQFLAPLVEKMPFDIVNTGNHECMLYRSWERALINLPDPYVNLLLSSVQDTGHRGDASSWRFHRLVGRSSFGFKYCHGRKWRSL
jgi:hypothetical protein